MTQSLSEHRAMLSMIRESLISTVQASLPSSDLSGLADRWMAYEDDYVVKSARYSGGRLSGYEVDFGVHALTVNIYYGALDGRVSYYRQANDTYGLTVNGTATCGRALSSKHLLVVV